jgi:glycosyltransferase involved in cell wall biosynthesis
MKIIGITMVRNEEDIVDLTIRHHLRIGCDRILVVDNGSTDQTPAILHRLEKQDDRIAWTSDPGPYRQSEVVTELAKTAKRLDADWVVPFDADEFWWCKPDTTLRTVLRDADDEVAVFVAPVVNFVQRRNQLSSSRRALLHMRMRAIPVPPAEEAMELVIGQKIGFVEIEYPPKTIFRADEEIVVGTGNHGVSGAPGHALLTSAVACLHAPLRSRHALVQMVEHGRRVSQASSNPSLGWQSRRWLELWDNGGSEGAWLDHEWSANSYLEGSLDVYGKRHRVEYDERLRSAIRPLLWRYPIR